jgi:hypothetical protein
MPEERAGGVSTAAIEGQVSALEKMRLAELREFWRGTQPCRWNDHKLAKAPARWRREC